MVNVELLRHIFAFYYLCCFCMFLSKTLKNNICHGPTDTKGVHPS